MGLSTKDVVDKFFVGGQEVRIPEGYTLAQLERGVLITKDKNGVPQTRPVVSVAENVRGRVCDHIIWTR